MQPTPTATGPSPVPCPSCSGHGYRSHGARWPYEPQPGRELGAFADRPEWVVVGEADWYCRECKSVVGSADLDADRCLTCTRDCRDCFGSGEAEGVVEARADNAAHERLTGRAA